MPLKGSHDRSGAFGRVVYMRVEKTVVFVAFVGVRTGVGMRVSDHLGTGRMSEIVIRFRDGL